MTIFSSFFKNVNWFYLLADLFLDFFCLFLCVYVTSREICVFTYCISTVFKFLVAAGCLDKEEQSKRLVCLKKNLNLSRRPNEDIEGQRKMFERAFSRGNAYWDDISSKKPSYENRSNVVPYVLLTHRKGLYLNLSGQRAVVL